MVLSVLFIDFYTVPLRHHYWAIPTLFLKNINQHNIHFSRCSWNYVKIKIVSPVYSCSHRTLTETHEQMHYVHTSMRKQQCSWRCTILHGVGILINQLPSMFSSTIRLWKAPFMTWTEDKKSPDSSFIFYIQLCECSQPENMTDMVLQRSRKLCDKNK